jgi:hypothetical protein
MHQVCVHAAFRFSDWVEYAVSGVRSSRSMSSPTDVRAWRSESPDCPHTNVSVDKNAAPCTNGRFDGPHRSIRGGRWKAAVGRSRGSYT